MAKGTWTGLTERQVAKRLGRLLDVPFEEGRALGLGTTPDGIAPVGLDAWVAVEVEHRHTHPVERVIAYWPWLERSRRRLLLVHAIAPDARRRSGTRTELTKWTGAMMERVLPGRFTYCRVELGTDGEAAQLHAAAAAITELRTSAHRRKLAPGL